MGMLSLCVSVVRTCANDCVSFGAVLEDFEVRDALANILVRKSEGEIMELDN